MTQRFATARLMCVMAGCLLVVTREGSPWAVLPGGHLQAGESPEAALVREIREETGRNLLAYQPLAVVPSVWTKGVGATAQTMEETVHLYTGLLDGPCLEGVTRGREPDLLFTWQPIPALVARCFVPLALVPYAVQAGGQALYR